MVTQRQLFQSRRSALAADLKGIEASIRAQEGSLTAYRAMLNSRKNQLALVHEELKNTRALVAEGYAPRNRQLELERTVSDLDASIADLIGNTTRAHESVAELQQRTIARQQEYRKEVETQLTDATREVQSDAEKFVAVRADLARTEIKSPATGQVVGLAIQTVGGVVQPGQKLMDVVPEGEDLLLEARIEPHLIDKVRTGLKTDVRFSAFSHSPQLVVQGEVISISKDLLSEQQGGMMMSYYLARVRVTPEGMAVLGQRTMQPGMPAEVVIKTGERTLLRYLLSPLTKRVAASMKEE
jgi:protease secretion system membrane fusion protein